MRFTPKFSRPVLTGKGLINVTLSSEEIEEILSEIYANTALLQMIQEYFRLACGEDILMAEAEEIELRQKIFPKIREVLGSRNELYQIFSAETVEVLFQRMENSISPGEG